MIRLITGLLMATMLVAGCRKSGSDTPPSNTPSPTQTSTTPVQKVGPAVVLPADDSKKVIADPYEIDWREDMPFNEQREALIATAEKSLDELLKAGAVKKQGWATVNLEKQHLMPDGTIDPEIMKHMRLGGIKVLRLGVLPFTDAGMLQLQSLRCLEELNVNSEKVTDAGLAGLKPLKSLRELFLDGFEGRPPIAITGEGFKDLAGLSKVWNVNIRRASMTDGGLAHLCKLKGITSLSLVNNKGSSRFLVGEFHSFGSMHARILSRRYSSSRNP